MSDHSDRHGRGWMGAIAVSPFVSSTYVPFPASEAATTALDGGPVRTLTAVADAWAVNQQVQAMYDRTNHGFLIRDALSGGSGEQRFYSRESRTNRPQLVVAFAAID